MVLVLMINLKNGKGFIDSGLFLQFPRKLMFTWTFDQHIQGLGRTQKKKKSENVKKLKIFLRITCNSGFTVYNIVNVASS